MSRTAGFVVLNLIFRREGKWVVGECVELGTSTFGRSYDEADERLHEAVQLHLEGLEDAGERERFFREHGIELYSSSPTEVIGRVAPGVFHKAHVIPAGEPVPVA